MDTSNNHELEIRNVVVNWITACVNGEIDLAMQYIASEDVVCFLPDIETHLHTPQLPDRFHSQPQKYKDLTIRITWMHVSLYEHTALAVFEAVFSISNILPQVQQTLHGTVILVCSDDKWLIRHAHLSVPNADLISELSSISLCNFLDPITSLYNRQFFELEMRRLDTERQLPLSIIIADIDALKMINDTFGHQEGDRLLAHVGRMIRESCRKEDIAARWGGDEFAILLPQTPYDAAEGITKRILAACNNSTFNSYIPSVSAGFASKHLMETDFSETFKEAENMMYRNKLINGKRMRQNFIAMMRSRLAKTTHETMAHCRRLKRIAFEMGSQIGLTESEFKALSSLAMIHDIGQVAVDHSILLKCMPLTEVEWSTIKRHPEIGYRMAMSAPNSVFVADCVLSHHERWDGSGYPLGTAGEDIPFLSRIFSVADAFEAMTHARPYRKAVSPEEAIEEIVKNAGIQFDPDMVDVFLSVYSKLKKRTI